MQDNLPRSQSLGAAASARAVQQQRVFQVVRYIHDHLDEPLDIPQLARVAHYSPTHLNRLFRGMVGEALYQYVKRIRLERAAVFLRLTRESVVATSTACGFDNHEVFTRAFTQAFGCSPRAFRQRGRSRAQLSAPLDLHYRPEGPPADFTPLPDRSGTLGVRYVELPPMRLAFVRHVGPYSQAYRAWPKLLWWAWRSGRLRERMQLFGLNYDDDDVTLPEQQRYDAAIVVEEDFQGDGLILAQTVEGGLFAQTTIVGSYDDYDRAWQTFFYQWLPQSGWALRALYGLDHYVLSPAFSGSPLGLVAEVLRQFHVQLHIPIAPGPCERSLLA